MDSRNVKLAHGLINYSTKLKKGEKVFIECIGTDTIELGRACVKEAYKVGALPFVSIKDMSVTRELILGNSKEDMEAMAKFELSRMKDMDAYIGIRGASNAAELADVPADAMKKYQECFQNEVHSKQRVNHTRWVVLRYPNYAMAQLANTSREAFEEFYYNVCCLDYAKMDKAMDSLKARLEKTSKVRLVAPGTDLTFSIAGMPAIKCAGELNIPDGEVYTAPVKDSVNGTISYNTPSIWAGFTYENIVLKFKDGKIVEATANNTEKINEVFNTDAGARYVGEFAIGVNPYVLHPMKDTLFDEKIAGSIHFTPGQCYEICPNGNDSAIHWDLVLIQRADYGGGEIYFDDELVRKDGIFVVEDLKCLNPENLK